MIGLERWLCGSNNLYTRVCHWLTGSYVGAGRCIYYKTFYTRLTQCMTLWTWRIYSSCIVILLSRSQHKRGLPLNSINVMVTHLTMLSNWHSNLGYSIYFVLRCFTKILYLYKKERKRKLLHIFVSGTYRYYFLVLSWHVWWKDILQKVIPQWDDSYALQIPLVKRLVMDYALC